ncbi:hypothetical protein [Halorhodospira halophila]|nr:hypothetical protein [Halorhodospira halophila]MBK1729642.1 hypothetical protein [Halorhodospira halophila]
MFGATQKALALIVLGVVGVIYAGMNVHEWAWWQTAGTQREQYDAVIIGLNGLAGLCMIIGGAFGGDRYYRDTHEGDWLGGSGGGGAALAPRMPLRIDREIFFSTQGSAAPFDLAIKLGFVILLCGHALIVYSRAVS